MIAYISSWARQVIVCVVIAIILEMILSPDSKSTKYIKTVIGIYIVYAIIAPGLKLMGGKNLDFASIDYENYFIESDIYQNMQSNVIEMQNNNFEETYKLNLKQDMEGKLREMGFIVSYIKLEVNLEEGSEEYGKIKEVEISLSRKNQNEDENGVNENKISINKIDVGTQAASRPKNNLTEKEESKIKEFMSGEYGIDKDKIILK